MDKSSARQDLNDPYSSDASSLGILDLNNAPHFSDFESVSSRSDGRPSAKPPMYKNDAPHFSDFESVLSRSDGRPSTKPPMYQTNAPHFSNFEIISSRSDGRPSTKPPTYQNGNTRSQQLHQTETAKWNNWHARNFTAVDYCDLSVEENTIDDRNNSYRPSSELFEPSEITGRSTECPVRATYSVEEILAKSISNDVRVLGAALGDLRVNESFSSAQSLPRTADLSMASTTDSNSVFIDFVKVGEFSFDKAQEVNESFKSYSKAKSILENDYKEWDNEYANIPDMNEKQKNGRNPTKSNDTNSAASSAKYDLNLSEFSRINFHTPNSNLSSDPNFSIGQFFNRRCEKIRDIIPNKSPKKTRAPIGLISPVTSPLANSSSHDSNQISIMNLSDIANSLDQWDNDSPHALGTKFLTKKSPRKPPTKLTSDKFKFTAVNGETIAPQKLIRNKPEKFTTKSPQSKQVSVSPKLASVSPKLAPVSPKQAPFNQYNRSPLSKLKPIAAKTVPFNSPTLTKSPEQFITSAKLTLLQTKNQTQNKENIGVDNTISFTESILDLTDQQPLPKTPKLKLNDQSVFVSPISENDRPNRKRPRQSIRQLLNSPVQSSIDIESPPTVEPLPSNYRTPKKSQPPQNDGVYIFSSSPNSSPKSPMSHYQQSPIASPVSSSCTNLNSSDRANTTKDTGRSISPTLLNQCNSQCSSSCDLTGKDSFPLKASNSEISWPSIKLRKSVVKSITIKNCSHKRMVLRMEVTGPGFQIAGNDYPCTRTLQGQECRKITIAFCPTTMGPATGKLCFSPTKDSTDRNMKIVKLYGYGGNTVLEVQGTERGPNDSFLKLGNIEDMSHMSIERTFRIYNRGPLQGVAIINVKSMTSDNIIETSNITITPQKCAINADTTQEIRVLFRPRRSYIRKIFKKEQSVATVAMLEVMYGDAPNRQRMASLVSRLKMDDPKYNTLDYLINSFPMEQELNFIYFDESTEHLKELFSTFKTETIALTLNRSLLNETYETETDLMISGLDESLFFRTIMSVDAKDTRPTINRPVQILSKPWSIYPTRLDLSPFNSNNIQTIRIYSNFSTPQTFEIDSNWPQLFVFRESCGVIEPCSEVDVTVIMKKHVAMPMGTIVVTVYIENDKIDLPVFVNVNA